MKKHKNSLIFLFWLVLICQNLVSQNIEQLYINLPDAMNPTLSKDQRHELLEYFKANQSDSVTNRFGTQTHILSLDTLNQHIKVLNTISSTFDMMLLYDKDSSVIIGVINTVCAPICMSNIQFYDTSWNVVPLKFKMPKSVDWLDPNRNRAEVIDGKWIENVLENNFVKLEFNAETKTVSAINQSLNFLNDDDLKIIKPLMMDKPFIYRLENKDWIK